MAPPLLQLRDIALTFGGASLLDGVELSVSPGERVCLVGRNGSGKSTLLKIAAGLIVSDGGTRFIQPDATIRYLPQEPDMSGFTTTLAYAEAGLTDGDAAHSARYLLEQLGLTGEENPATISGGEARRAALAHVLAPDPDILLLDEPTNHLDLPTIEWLEGELRSRKTALVLISHDRRFLQNLSRITVWLDRGKTRRLDVGFGDFEERRDAILAEEERDQHKLDRKIAAEEDWIRYGVTARRKRNVRRLADLQKMRKAQSDYRGPSGKATIAAAESDKSGTLVIEAKGIGKSFGDRTVVKDFSIRVHRGDRLGIVGPNGSGKTTLVNLLAGALSPDSGTIRLGTNLDIATLDQRRESLDPNWTLREAMTGGSGDTVTVGGQTRHVVSYMKDFLFTAEQIRTPLHALSGGERGRLMLARALARPSNLLVLDEPTNDLDLETLDVLEETLGDYAGTVILISHDRDFLDRVVSGVVVPEGTGKWTEYAGGYTDMVAQRGADLAPRAAGRATPKETRDRVADAPKTKRRLNFNEKYALENLPKQMEKLETEIVAFQKKLDDPALYERDRKSFDDTMAKLTAAQAALHAAEEKWLELEMLREEIERA
jgi:ATP-binding cassette subfamily F protein uup